MLRPLKRANLALLMATRRKMVIVSCHYIYAHCGKDKYISSYFHLLKKSIRLMPSVILRSTF